MTPTITLHFAQQLYPRQMKEFKSFIDNLAWKCEKALLNVGLCPDIITNKTIDGKNISRFPLVQCKIIRRQVVLFGIADGVVALKALMPFLGKRVTIGDQTYNLAFIDVLPGNHTFDKLRKPKQYHIYNWLALSKENLKEWNTAHTLANKIVVLEKILFGQISDCIQTTTGKKIKTLKNTILDINKKTTTKFREYENFVEFDVVFECNVLLPAELSLGFGKSVGFGKLIPSDYYVNTRPYSPEGINRKKIEKVL